MWKLRYRCRRSQRQRRARGWLERQEWVRRQAEPQRRPRRSARGQRHQSPAENLLLPRPAVCQAHRRGAIRKRPCLRAQGETPGWHRRPESGDVDERLRIHGAGHERGPALEGAHAGVVLHAEASLVRVEARDACRVADRAGHSRVRVGGVIAQCLPALDILREARVGRALSGEPDHHAARPCLASGSGEGVVHACLLADHAG
ncbi:hypothetical protein ACFPRL_25515 [Pseudoclavibacter helvolus]